MKKPRKRIVITMLCYLALLIIMWFVVGGRFSNWQPYAIYVCIAMFLLLLVEILFRPKQQRDVHLEQKQRLTWNKLVGTKRGKLRLLVAVFVPFPLFFTGITLVFVSLASTPYNVFLGRVALGCILFTLLIALPITLAIIWRLREPGVTWRSKDPPR